MLWSGHHGTGFMKREDQVYFEWDGEGYITYAGLFHRISGYVMRTGADPELKGRDGRDRQGIERVAGGAPSGVPVLRMGVDIPEVEDLGDED